MSFARFIGRQSEFYLWPGGVRAGVTLPYGALVEVVYPDVVMSGGSGNFPGSIVRYAGVVGYVPKSLLIPEIQSASAAIRPLPRPTHPNVGPLPSTSLYASYQNALARYGASSKITQGFYHQYLSARASETTAAAIRRAFRS